MRNTLVRDFIGFDNLFDQLFGNDIAFQKSQLFDNAYPRYNLLKNDTGYTIDLALAGFKKDELSVTVSNGILKVSGEHDWAYDSSNVLHNGISSKSFTRTFDLNSNLAIGDVSFIDGILSINLIKIEESDNIQKIDIQ